jgi:hypothetical protein
MKDENLSSLTPFAGHSVRASRTAKDWTWRVISIHSPERGGDADRHAIAPQIIVCPGFTQLGIHFFG